MSGPALALLHTPPPTAPRRPSRRAGLCAETLSGSVRPMLQGNHPHPSRAGLSPHGAQVGTRRGWAMAHSPLLTTAAPALGVQPRRLPGPQLGGAGVPHGSGQGSPDMLLAGTRQQWGRGGLKACEGGGDRGRGGAWGQVGVGRGAEGWAAAVEELGVEEPPACTHQSSGFRVLSFSRKEEGYFILFFYS